MFLPPTNLQHGCFCSFCCSAALIDFFFFFVCVCALPPVVWTTGARARFRSFLGGDVIPTGTGQPMGAPDVFGVGCFRNHQVCTSAAVLYLQSSLLWRLLISWKFGQCGASRGRVLRVNTPNTPRNKINTTRVLTSNNEKLRGYNLQEFLGGFYW